MKRLLYLTLIIVLVLTSMMIVPGCTPEIPKPDLLVVADPVNWVNFCDMDGIGNLEVHIKNQGTADAGPSTLEVNFSGQQAPTSISVPSILAGATITIPVPISGGCFSPDCGFEITVDSAGVINESNELNNSQVGSCLG
jgi:hypothetical protein